MAGVPVVFSGGNSGPYWYTVENSAPWVYTVGAGTQDRKFVSRVVLDNGLSFEVSLFEDVYFQSLLFLNCVFVFCPFSGYFCQQFRYS